MRIFFAISLPLFDNFVGPFEGTLMKKVSQMHDGNVSFQRPTKSMTINNLHAMIFLWRIYTFPPFRFSMGFVCLINHFTVYYVWETRNLWNKRDTEDLHVGQIRLRCYCNSSMRANIVIRALNSYLQPCDLSMQKNIIITITDKLASLMHNYWYDCSFLLFLLFHKDIAVENGIVQQWNFF